MLKGNTTKCQIITIAPCFKKRKAIFLTDDTLKYQTHQEGISVMQAAKPWYVFSIME